MIVAIIFQVEYVNEEMQEIHNMFNRNTRVSISMNKLIDGAQSDSAIDSRQADTEEECSFLKIENVVSLAPTLDHNESLIVCECFIIIFFISIIGI